VIAVCFRHITTLNAGCDQENLQQGTSCDDIVSGNVHRVSSALQLSSAVFLCLHQGPAH